MRAAAEKWNMRRKMNWKTQKQAAPTLSYCAAIKIIILLHRPPLSHPLQMFLFRTPSPTPPLKVCERWVLKKGWESKAPQIAQRQQKLLKVTNPVLKKKTRRQYFLLKTMCCFFFSENNFLCTGKFKVGLFESLVERNLCFARDKSFLVLRLHRAPPRFIWQRRRARLIQSSLHLSSSATNLISRQLACVPILPHL